MKEIKLNGSVLSLKGEEIKGPDGKPLKMNEIVADMLAMSKSDKAIRKLSIAQAMYLDGDMELEDADYKIVKSVMESSQASAIVVGQILKAMGVTE